MKRILITMASLLILCAHEVRSADSLQTRVAWLDSCPSDAPPILRAAQDRSAVIGLVVAAVAPKLIEGAVDTAAEALKAAGQTKTFATTANSATDFYKVSQSADLSVAISCLVIVRGIFDSAQPSPLQWARNSDEFKGLQRAYFQLEAKLKPVRGLKYFQLVPQFLKLEKFEEFSFFSHNTRDYVIAVTFTVPGAAQPVGSAEMTFKDLTSGTTLKEGDWRLRSASTLPIAFPTESMDVIKVKEKREAELAPYLLALDILSPMRTRQIPKAPDPYADKNVVYKAKSMCDAIVSQNRRLAKAYQIYDERCNYPLTTVREEFDDSLRIANRNPLRQAWALNVCRYVKADAVRKTAASCSNQPSAPDLNNASFTYFTTQLTLSEAREGSKFALYLGNALSASKAEVSSALQSKLLPKSQTVKDNEATAARTVRTAALVADLEVTKAEESLADTLLAEPPVPVDITDARIELLKAKIAANDAHRKNGISIPYPEID
jgi:hypothetical protein